MPSFSLKSEGDVNGQCVSYPESGDKYMGKTSTKLWSLPLPVQGFISPSTLAVKAKWNKKSWRSIFERLSLNLDYLLPQNVETKNLSQIQIWVKISSHNF